MASLAAARAFVYAEGRVVDQRLLATLFDEAPATGVVRALEAYRNDDGGFGHGLEPDKRCPASQPLDVVTAFEILGLAGGDASGLAFTTCGFLERVADGNGAVPFLLPSAREYPRAAHLDLDAFYAPSVWPTSSAAAWLHAFGVRHPWLDRATAFCLDELERVQPTDAHAIREALRLVRHIPDRARADALRPRLAAQLAGAAYFVADAADDAYGVTPLELDRDLFDDVTWESHLDRLAADQQADGGWPIRWDPPSAASRLDWRAHQTVLALQTLHANGRL